VTARYARIAWNVLTLSPMARSYPDLALRRLWKSIPPRRYENRLVRMYGRFLHRRACASQPRKPLDVIFQTSFFRNLPQLEVLQRLVSARPYATAMTVASIGCSSGAELYSAKWMVRCARPDLRVVATGVDLDNDALVKATRGVYRRGERELTGLSDAMVDRLATDAPYPLFAREGDHLTISEALRADVTWRHADARDPGLATLLGAHDVVMVNNILCHMRDPEAEACLRNVLRAVAPGGYLLSFGINLDVREHVVLGAGLAPVKDDIERVYLADSDALSKWPLRYWGCEPFDRRRRDWATRYGTVFQRPFAGMRLHADEGTCR